MNHFTLIHSDSFSPGTDQEHSASRETGCDPNDTLNYTQMHSHTHSHPVIGRPLGGSARSDRTYLGAGLWELWEQIQAGRSLWSVFIHDSAGGSSVDRRILRRQAAASSLLLSTHRRRYSARTRPPPPSSTSLSSLLPPRSSEHHSALSSFSGHAPVP